MIGFGPRAWLAREVEQDPSWTQRLSAEEIAGFDAALVHAKAARKDLLDMTAEDFPLSAAAADALRRAIDGVQGRWGMRLVKGLPVERWSEADCRLAYWGMGLHIGVARTQNRASQIMSDVRDEGGSYRAKGGRGYNTNAGLDFHGDSCDVVGLLCRRTAKAGGMSKVISSIALADELQRLRPDLYPALSADWFHSYQGAQDPSQPPIYRCPLLGGHGGAFAMRTNRKNTIAAQIDFPETPRLTPQQAELLDVMDALMASPRLCFSMQLERGDLQLLNSYVTLHSRTEFEDHEEPDQKRHLYRLWLAIPGSQPLSPAWEEYWGDTRAGAVRGGYRGSAITTQFQAYEARQAALLGMRIKR